MTELVWAPRASNKKPIFSFRSEMSHFGKSTRCLIPASHFFEFTASADPKQKRPDAIDGAACFTMLTTEPGADVAPYHDRQVVVLRRQDWGAWLDSARPEVELLRPLPTGSLKTQMEHEPP